MILDIRHDLYMVSADCVMGLNMVTEASPKRRQVITNSDVGIHETVVFIVLALVARHKTYLKKIQRTCSVGFHP